MKDDIRGIIRHLARDGSIPHAVPCVVDAVDVDKALCDVTPLDGGASILDVRLQAAPGSGLLLVPVIGSTVYVHHVTPDVAILSMPSNLQGIAIESDTASLKDLLVSLVDKIRLFTVTTPSGPSGTIDSMPTNKAALDAFVLALDDLFVR